MGVAVTAHNDSDPGGGVAVISDLSVVQTQTTSQVAFLEEPKDAVTYGGCEVSFSCVATNTAITNGTVSCQWFKNNQVIADNAGSQFTFLAGPGDDGDQVYCRVTNAAGIMCSRTGIVSVLTGTTYPGLKREIWNYQNCENVRVGNCPPAGRVAALTTLEAPSNWGEGYAGRVSGLFFPPVSGNYVFFVSSDDKSDLYLSTDANPANKRLIAQESAWSSARQWTESGGGSVLSQKRSDQWSPDGGITRPYLTGIHLVAGQSYYIEAIHRQGFGPDNLAATYKLVTEGDPLSGDPTRLTNSPSQVMLRYLTWPVTQLVVAANPQDVTTRSDHLAAFTAVFQTDSEVPPQYQMAEKWDEHPWRHGSHPEVHREAG